MTSIWGLAKFFTQGVAAAIQAGYARPTTGATFNNVYYLPVVFQEQDILHEALQHFSRC
jgi:hypothetical protein